MVPSSLEIQMKRETDCRRWNKNIFLLDALVLFGLISIISLRQSGDCPSATHMIKCLQWWICFKRWSSWTILSGGLCSILPWGNIKYYDWSCYQFQHIATPHICHNHHNRWLCKKFQSSVKFYKVERKETNLILHKRCSFTKIV